MARTASETVRKAVMEAALTLLAEQGYLKTTMEGIAARAGAGKQTLYRRWGSKADLYLELYEDLIPPTALDLDTGSTRADLEGLLTRLFVIYGNTQINRALAGLVAELPHAPDFADRMRERFLKKRRGMIATIAQRGVARGELRADIDPEFVSDLISGAVWFRVLLEHQPLDQAYATQLVDYVLKGIEA